MMKNKRGLIRILEATVAIMLVAGVLLVAYSKQQSADSSSRDSRDYIYNMQKKVLGDISVRDDLRIAALQSDDSTIDPKLEDYVSSQIPSEFGYAVRVCKLENPSTPCKMSPENFVSAGGADIYVEETLVSADLSEYDPKMVRLFIWEKI